MRHQPRNNNNNNNSSSSSSSVCKNDVMVWSLYCSMYWLSHRTGASRLQLCCWGRGGRREVRGGCSDHWHSWRWWL